MDEGGANCCDLISGGSSRFRFRFFGNEGGGGGEVRERE